MTITARTEPHRSTTDRAAAAVTARTGEPNHPAEANRTGVPANRTGEANHPAAAAVPAPVVLPAGWLFALLIALGTGLTIAGAAFKFSFTNVKLLGVDLGVAKDVAPWVAPTVDLGIVGMAVAVQWLSLAGIAEHRLKGPHRWMIISGALTLALNAAPAFIAAYVDSDPRAFGRGLYESVAPAMLIGWTYYLPRMVQMFVELRTRQRAAGIAAARAEREAAAELERLEAVSKAEAVRLVAEAEAAARRAQLDDQAAARQLEADLAISKARAEAEIAATRARADAEIELRRLEIADRQAERIAAQRDAAAVAAAQLERDRLAADRASAEATAAAELAAAERERAAAAEANRLAAEAARAAVEARTASRTAPEQRGRTEPASGTAARKTRTEPARTTGGAGQGQHRDNVVGIARGADGMRETLAAIHGSLTAADNVQSWADVWTPEGWRVGLNDIHRRTGIRKPAIMAAIKHAEDLYPWPGSPAGDLEGEEANTG